MWEGCVDRIGFLGLELTMLDDHPSTIVQDKNETVCRTQKYKRSAASSIQRMVHV